MRRIGQRLTAAPRLTPEEIGAIQADVVGVRPAELGPRLVTLLREATDPAARRLAGVLDGWDGSYVLDSAAPTAWTAFWERWLRRVAAARFPERLVPLVASQAGNVARALLEGRDTTPPWLDGADVAAELTAVAAETSGELEARWGPSPEGWVWGTVHTVTWRHPLSEHGPADLRAAAAALFDVGPFPTTGGATVRAAGPGATRPYEVTGGATYRMVADLSPAGGLRTTATTGQSGHPTSPHYADQAPLWAGDRYHPFPLDDFSPVAVTRIRPDTPA
jgi:penicillin amidase